ncbi:hypothetical protein QY882_09490 [Latilactobacillus sakei]
MRNIKKSKNNAKNLKRALADAQQAVATIQETLDQTGEFRFYQTHQAEIDGLLEQWSTRQKQAQQLALQQTQLTQLTSEQAALVAKYQWPTTETLPTVLSADQPRTVTSCQYHLRTNANDQPRFNGSINNID